MERETKLARGELPGLDRATIHPYVDATPGPFYYQRVAHPVGLEAERVLGELEGSEALLWRRSARPPGSWPRRTRPGCSCEGLAVRAERQSAGALEADLAQALEAV